MVDMSGQGCYKIKFISLLCFESLEPIILRIEFSKESQGVVLSDEMKEELFNKYIFNQL